MDLILTIINISLIFFFSDTQLDDDGAIRIADVLKVNKTLMMIDLRSNSSYYFCFIVFTPVVCRHTGNRIGDTGGAKILEALKVNKALFSVNVLCEHTSHILVAFLQFLTRVYCCVSLRQSIERRAASANPTCM